MSVYVLKFIYSAGSMSSSILSGTPEAPSMLAACPSAGLLALGLGSTPVFARVDDAWGVLLPCMSLFKTDCALLGPVGLRGDADAFEALSDIPPECCEDVRGETRPF